MDPTKYARRELAIEQGLRTHLAVAHLKGGKVKGVMEFLLIESKPLDADIVNDIKSMI
jgi:hypothetical protein